MTEFFRFPHTPHLAWLGQGEPRDDKLLTADEVSALLAGEVVVEEKLDGANLGISIGADGILRAQNRGAWLTPPYSGQFSRLGQWLGMHEQRFFDALDSQLIVFGEWCAARHSLDYSSLPDWWLMFDVYDSTEGLFWSTRRRNALAEKLGVLTVPRVLQGKLNVASIEALVANNPSRFRPGTMEGVVVRREDDDWLQMRGKLVRADFTQTIETHWRSRNVEWNRVRHDLEYDHDGARQGA
ncbi:MAG: RNA ligase family protein [Pseudomonadales bacterium]|jgi:ATP-dependent RNA circularization protein (DNA/RNA ligase family)|nr:RNA ligase family protein [Pseudomonadales bacterium]